MNNQQQQNTITLLELAQQQQANERLHKRYYVIITRDGAQLKQMCDAYLRNYRRIEDVEIVDENGTSYYLQAYAKIDDLTTLIEEQETIGHCWDCGYMALISTLDLYDNGGRLLFATICGASDMRFYDTHDGVATRRVSLCDDCARNYNTCDRCGGLIFFGDTNNVHDEYGDTLTYCDDCVERHTWTCEECGHIYTNDCDCVDVEGDCLCEDCASSVSVECEDCGCHIYERNAIEINGRYYCEDCASDHDEDEDYNEYDRANAICDYHASHHKTHYYYSANDVQNEAQMGVAYMGVEIETSHAGSSASAERVARIIRALDPNERKFFIEHDGSLESGFEIISQPFTLDRLQDMQLFEAQDIASANGMRAHDVSDCGLHVHISREALGNTLNKQYNTLLRIMDFYDQFERDLQLFARREYNSYNNAFYYEWDAFDTRRDAIRAVMPDANGVGRMSRYYTLNTNNAKTLEFRGARGTLNNATLKATLGFYYYLVLACRELTSKEYYDGERINASAVLAYMPDYVCEYLRSRNAFVQYMGVNNPAPATQNDAVLMEV